MDYGNHIDEIVKSYGIIDYRIEKFRSVYKINSKSNVLLVKKFNSKIKLLNTKKIINQLKYNDFNFVQNIRYNLKNEFYFEFENKFYMCFKWIDGREVNAKKIGEIKKCTKIIYLFHEAVKNINDTSIILNDESNWIEKFEQDLSNLYYIQKTISKKYKLSELDKFYYGNIYSAISKINKIINFLNKHNFKNFTDENKIICHNSLYYQNFILNNGKIFLIDFGGMVLNNRIYDIARFARRVFYKNKFNFNVLNQIYKIYDNNYKFSEFEKKLFENYLEYPYKFVKLGYKFYIQNKDINQDRLLNKLEKYCKYELEF